MYVWLFSGTREHKQIRGPPWEGLVKIQRTVAYELLISEARITCLTYFIRFLQEKCHEKKCRKEITDPKQYGNITANYCDHRCCTENLCNTGMLVSNASESLP